MPGSFTNDFEAKILNSVFNSDALRLPGATNVTGLKVALYTGTAAPTTDDAFAGMTELTSGATGYARTDVTLTAATPSSTQVANTAVVQFPQNSGVSNWPEVKACAILTSAGDRIVWAGLSAGVIVAPNQAFTFATGQLIISLD